MNFWGPRLWVFCIVFLLSMFVGSPAKAEYALNPPLAVQLQEAALRQKPFEYATAYERFIVHELANGKSYRPGRVAYFWVFSDFATGRVFETRMQLEEWTLLDFLPEVTYLVTFSKFEATGVLRWTLGLTQDGHLLIETLGPNSWFDATSPEAIEASKLTQAMLTEVIKKTGQ